MDESTSSAPRGSSSLVSYSSAQTILDSLVIAQPFQSGGSLADDLLFAFEIAKSSISNQVSVSDYALNAILKRLDNPKRFKTKCDLVFAHRPNQFELYLVIISKILEDPSVISVLKAEGADLSPGKAEQLVRDTIQKLVKSQSEDRSITKSHEDEIPVLPHWFLHRPGLSDDLVSLNRAFPQEKVPKGGVGESQEERPLAPLEAQEQMLIEDVLYTMMGIEGKYIVLEQSIDDEDENKLSNEKSIKFVVLRNVSPLHDSLVGLVERMLPLSECYIEINKFVDDFSQFICGMVAHAVAAAISSLLRDYLILVAQLEQKSRNGTLTLQKLWYYIQTSLDSMSLLRDLVREAKYKKKFGAQLLNLIHDRWQRSASDKSASDLFLYLLQKGSVPYWDILKSWIYKGFVKDPYGEFLVEENRAVSKGSSSSHGLEELYWEKKYTLRQDQVPVFLEAVKDKILTTGKYINAIRECGMHISSESSKEPLLNKNEPKNDQDKSDTSESTKESNHIVFTQVVEEFAFLSNEREEYFEKIERAYKYASGRLLQVLRKDYQLLSKLRSIKHYFLLDQGDFYIHFMDVAEEELKKPANAVQPSTLQTLVDIAVRSSIAKDDELGENIHVRLLPYNLVNQLISRSRNEIPDGNLKDLTALEALTLEWKVNWPLVLIFNKTTLDMYQILFRHLFYCKHVERILGRAWTQHQLTKQMFFAERKRPAPSGPKLSHFTKNNNSISNSASAPAIQPSSSIPPTISDAGSDYQLLTRCFSLRQRMLHFIQNLQYYMIMEVIEPRYFKLEDALKKAQTVDELLLAHNTFLIECHRNCLLTELELIKIITKIMSVCVIFCNYTERFIKQLTLEENTEPSQPKTKGAPPKLNQRQTVASLEGRKVLAEKGFGATMSRFEANFDKYYRMLMEATTSFQNPAYPDHGLLSLNIRLDFNDYYSNRYQQGYSM